VPCLHDLRRIDRDSTFQLENSRADFDKPLYEKKNMLLETTFLLILTDAKTCEVGETLASLIYIVLKLCMVIDLF